MFRARKRTPFGPRRDLDAQISPTFGRGSLRVASRTVCGRTRRAGPAGGTRRERSADRINPGLFTGRCWPRKTEGFSAGIGRIWTKAGTVESPFCRPRPWGVKGRRVTAQDKTRSVRPRGRFVLFVFDVCGSSNDAWESFENNTSAKVLGGVNLRAAVPSLQLPNLFKRDDDGKIVLTKGDEYYDDDSPYYGVYVDYISELIRISNGDILRVNFTATSEGNQRKHPTSSYTAAVQDVANGLVDLSVAPFWITPRRQGSRTKRNNSFFLSETSDSYRRLALTAFTVPLFYDKTVLVIPRPGINTSFFYQTMKVFGKSKTSEFDFTPLSFTGPNRADGSFLFRTPGRRRLDYCRVGSARNSVRRQEPAGAATVRPGAARAESERGEYGGGE